MARSLIYKDPYRLVCPGCNHSNPLLCAQCRYCSQSWTAEEVQAALSTTGIQLTSLEAEVGRGIPLNFWRQLTSFSGRLSLRLYWAYLVPLFVLGWFAMQGFDAPNSTKGSFLYLLASVPLTWCALAISAKRLHDFGRSGTWALLMLIPYAGLLVAFIIGFVPGTRSANAFGPTANTAPHPAAAA